MTTTDAYRSPPAFAEWAKAEIELRFWHEALESLEAERQQATPEAIKAAHDFAIRAAAVDTAAIEGLYQVDRGFTFSVAAQTGAWEHYFDERGEKAREVFEDQLRSFDLVLDAATGQLPVVEALIRSLHELVCASQDTYRVLTEQGWQEQELVKGEYKRHPNNPRLPDGRQHHYAPPLQVKEEMERLTAELASPAFAAAPAPVQAAYAHFAFVTIHPFPDGNGRVARALASIYLVRATSVPFVVFADQNPAYLDALARADQGGWGEFSKYVRDRSMDAMNLAVTSLQEALSVLPESLRVEADRLYRTRPNLSHGQADQLAETLLKELGKELTLAFESFGLPKDLSLQVENRAALSLAPPPLGYRLLGSSKVYLGVTVASQPPAAASTSVTIRPLVNRDAHHPMLFRLEVSAGASHFDTRLEDLQPGLSESTKLRLAAWSKVLLAPMIRQVVEEGGRVLERSGWNG
jgi:Fic family protein